MSHPWPKMFRRLPPAEVIRALFLYDEKDGLFRYARGRDKGKIACNIRRGGDYRMLHFPKEHGGSFAAHRVAWKYVHGVDPRAVIDHINGTRDDNRIANLRDVSYRENARNNHGNWWSEEKKARRTRAKAEREAKKQRRRTDRAMTSSALLSFGA